MCPLPLATMRCHDLLAIHTLYYLVIIHTTPYNVFVAFSFGQTMDIKFYWADYSEFHVIKRDTLYRLYSKLRSLNF